MALASNPRLLLLDEPTAGMSPEETRAMMDLIVKLAGERTVTETFPRMLEQVSNFQRVHLNTEYQYRLAQRALDLRSHGVLSTLTPADFLQVRRPEDEAPTLWNVFNRVQEAAVYGGTASRSFGFGRATVSRPVERVSAVTAINTGLWDEATAIYEELA